MENNDSGKVWFSNSTSIRRWYRIIPTKRKIATLNVRKEQMEFEQKLVADLTNRIS
jgi:hypothetical protein